MNKFQSSKPSYSRRSFLGSLGVGAASALGGFPAFVPSKANAQASWGNLAGGVMPSGKGPYKVLEIHCFGAPSIWETLWITQNNGQPNFRDFDAEMAAAEFLCASTDGSVPSSSTTTEFAVDGLGNEIFWGAAATPLLPFKNRTRMVVLAHENPRIPIHEAAAPYAVTGTRLGDPRHAGAGAAFQHRYRSLDPDRLVPHAYVIGTGSPTGIGNLYNAALATGAHTGGQKPLFIRIDQADELVGRLQRPNASNARDRLLASLTGQYRDRLRFLGQVQPPIRSEGFASYEAAMQSAFNAPSLVNILGADNVQVPTAEYCVNPAPVIMPNNPTAAGLDLARSLLTNSQNPASYVMVADTGIERLDNGNQPCYDTHPSLIGSNFEQVRVTTANLYNLFSSLAAIIDPTGTDPTKINLNDTMIVINAEFGRKPFGETRSPDLHIGRNHWPQGYVGLLIGGPISTASIAGGLQSNQIRLEDGSAPQGQWFSPTDFRGGILNAAHIWPFESELFGTSNFGPRIQVGTEIGNAKELSKQVLGLTGV